MAENPLGDGRAPIVDDYRAQMRAIAKHLDAVFNGTLERGSRKVGFVLLVFPFTGPGVPGGRCNYISNGAEPKQIAKLLREQAAHFEGEQWQQNHAS